MLTLTIPCDHASFSGHFPGNPILPGVLLLERVMAYAQSRITFGNYALLNVKFLASVGPGDTINLTLAESAPDNFAFAVYIANDSAGSRDTLACSGQLRRMAD